MIRKYLSKTRLLGAALVVALPAAALQAQDSEVPTEPETQAESESSAEPDITLETYISPTKFPAYYSEVGSALSLITSDELETRQIHTFEDAIKFSPGVIVASTGQPGSISSIFLRGVNANQSQILIDGVRISDSNIFSNLYLGSGVAHNFSRIEVLRGPQSALYGGEAIGGVISMWSPRGYGEQTSSLDFYGGSFGSFGTQFQTQAGEGPLAYSVSVGYDTTENDRPNNQFDNLYYATRFDLALSPDTTIGMTLRGADREVGVPGDIFTNDPDNYDLETFNLITAYFDHQVTDIWNTHLLTGWLSQNYESYFPPFGSSEINNDKVVLDWRNTFRLPGGHTTLFGVGYEETGVSNNGFGDIDETDSLVSLYFEQMLQVTDALSLTGGVRWEEYDSFGDAVTWRGTGAYHFEDMGTTLKASVGTGFRAPSFFELFATSSSFIGNPDLDPEESLGWDVGVEQEISDLGTFGVTWFHNNLDQLIVSDFAQFPATVVNLEEAMTQGLEVDWRSQLGKLLSYRLAYTYLQAENETSGSRLLRRPEHTLSFDVNRRFADRLTLGLGGYWIQNRLDVDPVTFGTIPGDDYFLARIYGNLEVTENIDSNLRIENAFDEDYMEVEGFPGRGLGIFGGVTIRF